MRPAKNPGAATYFADAAKHSADAAAYFADAAAYFADAAAYFVDAAAYEQPLPFFVSTLRNAATRLITEHLTGRNWRTRFVLNRIFVDGAH